MLARQQQFTCFIISIETQLTNLITPFLIILQTNNNFDDMAGVVDPYIIVDQCLEWIGFGIPNQRASISTEAGFNSLNDLNDIEEKDIRDMADSFQKRTIANRINFGMRRTKWLIAMMHWVQDFSHCSKQPTIDDFVTANDFKQALSTAAQRASLHKVDTDQVDTISKAAGPGKLKDERKWPEWYPAFVNYLSTIPGVYGVPLSYIVHDNEAPDHMRDFAGDFTEEIIACAPLNGPKFRADARKVHQLLKNFLMAESAEQWIRPLAPRGNGCDDILELRRHYEGKGNQSRRIASADKYHETLHYKSERAMPWETFLDRMQKMFNIYKEEGEEMTENAKLRELFKRTKHPQLTESVKALEVCYNMDGLTYTQAANHLTAAVSKLPDYQMAHRVSNVKTTGTGGNKQGRIRCNRNSIYATDGTIWTGHYDKWATMKDADKEKVTVEREHKKKARTGKGSKGKTYKRKVSDLSSLTEDIQAMKRLVAELISKRDEMVDEGATKPPCNDARNAFGGRAYKFKVKSD